MPSAAAPADLEKIAKMLAMTASDSDGEALAAARAANRFLAQNGWGWAEILKPVTYPRKPPKSVSELNSLFITILDEIRYSPYLSMWRGWMAATRRSAEARPLTNAEKHRITHLLMAHASDEGI